MKNIIPLILLLFLASSCSQKRYGSVPKIKAKKIVQNEQRTIKKPRVSIPSVVLSPVKTLPEIKLRDSIVIRPIPAIVTVARPANINVNKNTAVKESRTETVKTRATTKSARKTATAENNRLKKILKIALIIILVAGLIILIIKIVPAATLAIILGIIVAVLYIALMLAVLYYCMKLFLDFVLMMGGN